MTTEQTTEKDRAIEELRTRLKPGDTIHCILRHVSESGMSRRISFLKITPDGGYFYLDYLISQALGYKLGNVGITVKGCGMDMGFAVVYELGRALYPKGFGELGTAPGGNKIRPFSEQDAFLATQSGVKFRGRNSDESGWDHDGGYALKYHWL